MATKTPPLRYFYYDGMLHKKIHINKPADVLTAFCYKENKVKKYVYSHVRRHGRKAFTTNEVCALVGRNRVIVQTSIDKGHIPAPEKIAKGAEFIGKYYWCEEDIYRLHDYLMTIHYGRPRKDGRINPAPGLPTRRELRAMIDNKPVFYVEEDGEFRPTWHS